MSGHAPAEWTAQHQPCACRVGRRERVLDRTSANPHIRLGAVSRKTVQRPRVRCRHVRAQPSSRLSVNATVTP